MSLKNINVIFRKFMKKARKWYQTWYNLCNIVRTWTEFQWGSMRACVNEGPANEVLIVFKVPIWSTELAPLSYDNPVMNLRQWGSRGGVQTHIFLQIRLQTARLQIHLPPLSLMSLTMTKMTEWRSLSLIIQLINFISTKLKKHDTYFQHDTYWNYRIMLIKLIKLIMLLKYRIMLKNSIKMTFFNDTIIANCAWHIKKLKEIIAFSKKCYRMVYSMIGFRKN